MKLLPTLLNIFFLVSPLLAQLSPGDLHKSHQHLEGLKNCTKCHEVGKKVSKRKCLDCHKILRERIAAGKGMHANSNYNRCVKCHVEHQGRNYNLIYWEKGKEKFGHALTGYKLEGKHAEQKCEDCHRPQNVVIGGRLKKQKKNLKKTFLGLSQQCSSCHEDEHRNQLPETCFNCHNYDDWKSAKKFDHNKAHFRLTGKHRDVKCEKCHKRVTDHKFSDNPDYLIVAGLKYRQCLDCHEDKHNNKFGRQCESCHNTSGWKNYDSAKFNHEKTDFRLRGRHANLACRKCHLSGKPLKIAKFNKCRDCHKDYHQGQFAHRSQKGDCEECHTVNGFSPSQYTVIEHNKSDYPLKGSHLAVPCIACHKKINVRTRLETIQFQFSSPRCQTCHENPHRHEVDKYISQNGCIFCHEEGSWSRVTFDHSKTKFPLQGMHGKTDCKKCHKPFEPKKYPAYLQFQKVIKLCQNCHEDIHQGQFRDVKVFKKTKKNFTRCDKCHVPVDWLAEKFDHNRDTKFKLDGGHKRVPCNKCHVTKKVNGKEVTIYKALDTDCKYCHRKK